MRTVIKTHGVNEAVLPDRKIYTLNVATMAEKFIGAGVQLLDFDIQAGLDIDDAITLCGGLRRAL